MTKPLTTSEGNPFIKAGTHYGTWIGYQVTIYNSKDGKESHFTTKDRTNSTKVKVKIVVRNKKATVYPTDK